MVDVFFISPDMITMPNAVIQMYLWVHIRLTNDDSANHSLSFELVRPSGERTNNVIMKDQPLPPPRFPDLHKQISAQGLVNVVPKEVGDHTFLINFDGEVVTKAFFTIVAKQETQSSQPN
jgi:hypothetical protein